MKQSKIIVTGGAGFIGSNFIEFLNEKGIEDIILIDNLSTGNLDNLKGLKISKFVREDLSKDGNWQKEILDADYVVHFASLADIVPSIENPDLYFQSNVEATLKLCSSLRKCTKLKKYIYSASSSCYGVGEIFPTPEDSIIDTQYPYALTKYLGEEISLHWSKVYKIPTISLRYFNVYGPKSRTNGTYGAMFGTFLAQKLSSKPLTIVGDGTQKRDFIYVSDVCSAVYQSMISDVNSVALNVGTGTSTSVLDVAKMISNSLTHIEKRPGEPSETLADITQIKKLTGWSPVISINVGVNMLLKSISYWEKAPVWTAETIKDATKDWFKYLGK